jgi:hypothetical protein
MRKTFLAASSFAGVLASSHAWSVPPKACSFPRGTIRHIVYLQSDNTHFIRDVPYVRPTRSTWPPGAHGGRSRHERISPEADIAAISSHDQNGWEAVGLLSNPGRW